MTKNFTDQTELTPKQERNIFRIALVTLIGTGLVSAYYFLPSSGVSISFFSPNIQLGFLFLVSLFSIWLIRSGRSKAAIILILGATPIALIVVTIKTSGLDIILATMLIAITFGTASITLPRKDARRAIYGSVFIALYFVFLSIAEPFNRESITANNATWIITGSFTVGFLLLVFQQFRTYALRVKLIVAFVFLSTIGVSIAFLFANFDMRQVLQENAQKRLLAGASASASEIDSYLNYRVESVALASTYVELRTFLSRPTSQISRQALNILFSLANSDSDALSYGILDLEGMNLADSNTKNVGLSEADQDYFQLPLNASTTYISPVLYLSDSDRGSLFISAPIRNDMGVMTGILRAQYRASVLQDLLTEKKNIAGEGAFSVLFDSNHIVLAHELNPDLIGKVSYAPNEDNIKSLREYFLLPANLLDDQILLDSKAVDDGLANFATTPYFSSEETALLGFAISGAVVQLDTIPWLVVSAQPEEIFLAPAQRQAQRALYAAIAVIIFAALSAFGVANILAAPILQLQKTAQQFSEGDLSVKAVVDTEDEIGLLATTFNKLTSQLRGTVDALEERIEERTKDLASRTSYLESAAEVSRAVSSIMSADALASEVTELIKERFNLYYAGLFLVDQNKEWAVLRAGTGQAGQKMLENNHKIEIGKGMIGWCIEHAESRIALDVGEDAVRFENPVLPGTRSEGALPLRSRGRVLGALTVQSTEEAAFDESIITTLQTMTDQIAIAIDNAELFAKAEEALLSERRAYGQLSQKSWQAMTKNKSISRFIVKEDGTENKASYENKPINVGEIAKNGKPVQGDNLTVVMPIKNRDYVLGGIKISKKEGASPWSTEELTVIESISEQLSVALESARLFDQTQRKAQRETIISDISAKIGESRSVDAIISTTIKELGDALSSPEVSFHLQEHSPSSEKKAEDE